MRETPRAQLEDLAITRYARRGDPSLSIRTETLDLPLALGSDRSDGRAVVHRLPQLDETDPDGSPE